MKKFNIFLSLALLTLVSFMNGCKKVNCPELAQQVSNAVMEYAYDQSTANCEALNDAIKDWYDKCTVTAAQKAIYDDMLDSCK